MDNSELMFAFPHNRRHKVGSVDPQGHIDIYSSHMPLHLDITAEFLTTQRTHDEMEASASRRSSSLLPQPSSSTHPFPNMPSQQLNLPQIRYPGDGFDMRRPVPATIELIDLTSEAEPRPSEQAFPAQAQQHMPPASRPPRYDREIIDLSAEPAPANASDATVRNAPSSPEVEFLSSRRLPAPQQPASNSRSPDFDFTTDDDFEIVEGGTRRRWEQNIRRSLGIGTMPALAPRAGGANLAIVHGFQFDDMRLGGLDFNFPHLEYGNVGFRFERDRSETPPPDYNPPPPAPKGFTRSPDEDEVLLCPNCGDELCTGDSDLKKQVWVIRSCGHVS